MGLVYLSTLLLVLGCMVLIDYRWKLVFFAPGQAVRAALTIATGVVFFVLWDLVGIATGVFFRGAGPFMTGLQVAPELPIEEIFFLTFLCYLTMNMWRGGVRLLDARGSRASDGRGAAR